jgi:hypothetical protein
MSGVPREVSGSAPGFLRPNVPTLGGCQVLPSDNPYNTDISQSPVEKIQVAFVHPATHYASSSTDPNDPPMGLRVRLKASFDLSGFKGQSLVVLTALKRYGMFLGQNGSDWYVAGETDPRWNDTDLDQIKTVPASAFEVVQLGPHSRELLGGHASEDRESVT